jgi:hypothetical protein
MSCLTVDVSSGASTPSHHDGGTLLFAIAYQKHAMTLSFGMLYSPSRYIFPIALNADG